jgi:succinate dehydrogenase / fumarate reductase cytochrome b subunit
MKWLVNFLTSSLGKKVIMSLTGLFLCSFLVIHMIGNLKLFADSDGHKFNEYAEFMAHNPIIKTVSYGLYFFILLHAIQGLLLAVANKSASGGSNRYAGKQTSPTEAKVASRNMALLGTLILAFLLLHMGQFWLKAKIIGLADGVTLYDEVKIAFAQEWVVITYLLGLVALALHLIHGFQSAFQTLGLTHPKYTPIVKGLGWMFSILVPLGFASMPIYFYIMHINGAN